MARSNSVIDPWFPATINAPNTADVITSMRTNAAAINESTPVPKTMQTVHVNEREGNHVKRGAWPTVIQTPAQAVVLISVAAA